MPVAESLPESETRSTTDIPLRILLVDDDSNLRNALERVMTQNGYSVRLAANADQAHRELESSAFSVILLDLVLPDGEGLELLREIKATQHETEVVVITAHGSIESAVEAMRWGAYDYLTKPFHPAEFLTTVGKALEKVSLQRENRCLRYQLSEQAVNRILVGNSPPMQQVKKLIEQVASSAAPVIIEGESGTGKELVAEAIHRASPRSHKPLIKVSCAALPETLLEAELFGYERGAFTGAVSRKPGRFDLAKGGTLFLDEIVDFPLTTQVKLLRVLQDGKYERLGGRETLYSDVRLIAATNRSLEQAVKEGRFREDLYYRINVITLPLPPLRDRKDEVPVLAHHFRQLYAARNCKNIRDISPATMSCLLAYDWPGNVRELENVVERAVVLCEGEIIQPHLLPVSLNAVSYRATPPDADHPTKASIITLSFPVGTSMRGIEDLSFRAMLEYAQDDRSAAARLLDIHPRTIVRHLQARKEGES